MGNRYGEWIPDVERLQFAAQQDNASGDNYAGSHVLYQDVTVPMMMDGTSNTFMYAEKFQPSSDGVHVLTVIQHASQPKASIPEKGDEVLIGFEFGDTTHKGSTTPGALLFHFSSEPNAAEGGVQKGDWITDVTYESVDVLGQPTVAIEALTIVHDGLLI